VAQISARGGSPEILDHASQAGFGKPTTRQLLPQPLCPYDDFVDHGHILPYAQPRTLGLSAGTSLSRVKRVAEIRLGQSW
jgi:hypothetical protein